MMHIANLETEWQQKVKAQRKNVIFRRSFKVRKNPLSHVDVKTRIVIGFVLKTGGVGSPL